MQTIKPKTAQKLKALRLKKKSDFLWVLLKNKKPKLIISNSPEAKRIYSPKELYPAYGLYEILKIYSSIIIEDRYCELKRNKEVYYFCYLGDDSPIFADTNPAEAAAQLLIWCIKNGHVKTKGLNNVKT